MYISSSELMSKFEKSHLRGITDTSTNPGDTIVIPFAGSGEVGNIGESRNVIMIEKSWEPGNSFPI